MPFRHVHACWLILTCVALLGGCGHSPDPPPVESPTDGVGAKTNVPLPQLSASPYLNTRSGVAYVGDAVCARCHRIQAESYVHHSMGRAVTPVRDFLANERLDSASNNPFTHDGLRFRVEKRGDRLIHYAQVGDVVETSSAAEVQCILGSSRQGRSYLVDHDGYLFQSPISWFSSKKIWGLSPGYEEDQLLFSRQITEQCLYCHSNGVAPVSGAVNHFPEPIFKSYGIGCERCHGPGQLHAEARRRGIKQEGVDFTIVNPRHLEPLLRDAVCEQCHLLGVARITRRGRSMQDFRPGLPIHEFVSVFVKPTDDLESQKSVSELHQLYLSTCFIKSAGKMSCISCHDPHGEPDPSERVALYRDRCLECHAEKGCSFPVVERKAVNAADNCIACHMPSKKSGDVPHAAVSDHRIPRKPNRVQSSHHAAETTGPPLRYFHEDRLKSVDHAEIQRDLGLAMIEMSWDIRPKNARPQIARQALPLLEAAVARAPDDLDAQAALGYALGTMESYGAALTVLDKVLSQSPRREDALIDAANFATAMGRTAAAVGYFERLIQVNPWMPSYRFSYAKVLHQRREWAKAIVACREAIRLDPTNSASRRLLAACLVAHGEPDKAASELRVLKAMSPKSKDELQRWFDSLPR